MTDTPKPLRYADVLRDSAAQLDALARELDALARELALVHRPGEQRAYRTGESVELEVQWRTLIDGKLYPIVTLPDGWTGRVRVTRIEEEK